MIDLEKGQNQLDKADGFLTKLKDLLKKHWGILTLIGIGVFIYWAFTLPPEEHVQPEETQVEDPIGNETHDGYYITKETYFVDDYGYRMGDTVYVDYYSDGYIEKYYTDGEMYVDDYEN